MSSPPVVKAELAPIRHLAEIARRIDEAAHDLSRVEELLACLLEVPDGLFEAAVRFDAGSDPRTFVVLRARGCSIREARRWLAWPLRRVFTRMKPTRILHHDRHALAIPFQRGAQRCVVLAVLTDRPLNSGYDALLATLERMTIPVTGAVPILSEDVPNTPVEPSIFGFGLCDDLLARIDSMLSHRDWKMHVPPNVRALKQALLERTPDILLFDACHVDAPGEYLAGLYRVCTDEPKVLGFGSEELAGPLEQSLIDAAVPHDAPESAIFTALKDLVRDLPTFRTRRLQQLNSQIEGAMLSARTPGELAAIAARHAAGLMHGWACVHLVAESGRLFSAEFPALARSVLSVLPKVFLNDRPTFQIRADERFYEETFDDERARNALAGLAPASAASIPLLHGERRLGALITVSRLDTIDSTRFEALDRFSRVIARCFEEMHAHSRVGPQLERTGVWECVRDGCIEMAVYRSSDCDIPWRYRSLSEEIGLLSIGGDVRTDLARGVNGLEPAEEARVALALENSDPPEGTRFVASVDTLGGSMAYAARAFPTPMFFDVHGPSGAVHTARDMTIGTATLASSGVLLICDQLLQRWLVDQRHAIENLTETIEDRRPPGLAVTVTMRLAS